MCRARGQNAEGRRSEHVHARAGSSPAAALTPLPRLEDLPVARQTATTARRSRRHSTPSGATSPRCRRSCACSRRRRKSAITEPSGHAVRMDALHLVRAAAEFADTIERDAQDAAAKQVGRAEQEIREKQIELQQREAEIARIRQETERQRDGDPQRGAQGVPRDPHQGEPRRDRRAARGRVPRQPADRAVAPPGDRADELRARRGRADARVGAGAGGADRPARPAWAPSSSSRRPATATPRSTRRWTRSSRQPRSRSRPSGRPLSPEAAPGSDADVSGAEPDELEPHDEPTPDASRPRNRPRMGGRARTRARLRRRRGAGGRSVPDRRSIFRLLALAGFLLTVALALWLAEVRPLLVVRRHGRRTPGRLDRSSGSPGARTSCASRPRAPRPRRLL